MKTLRLLPSLLVGLALLISAAHAQTTKDEMPASAVRARCQYVEDANCINDKDSTETNTVVAQLPRRFGPPLRPRPPMRPYPSYSNPWIGPGDGHHAAIGALIGLGVGAGLGATIKSKDGSRFVGTVLLGGLGAAFGSAIGYAVPVFHTRNHGPHFPDDEMASPDQGRKLHDGQPDGQAAGN